MAQTPPKKQTERKPDDPPQRRNWVASVSRDLGATTTAIFARAGFTDPALVLHWREIAGVEVARLARPVRFSEKDGALTLLAEPAAALFLSHESRALAGRINAWLGRPAVTKIKFIQGRLAERAAPPPAPRPGTAPKSSDPSNAYRGPADLKAALQSLARWRSGPENRGD